MPRLNIQINTELDRDDRIRISFEANIPNDADGQKLMAILKVAMNAADAKLNPCPRFNGANEMTIIRCDPSSVVVSHADGRYECSVICNKIVVNKTKDGTTTITGPPDMFNSEMLM